MTGAAAPPPPACTHAHSLSPGSVRAFTLKDNSASLELHRDELLKKYLEKIGKPAYLTLNLEAEAEAKQNK